MAKGSVINLSGAIARTIILYAYTLLLARALSINELGEYYLLFTILNILGLVAAVGLDFGVVRYVSLNYGERKFLLAKKALSAGLWLAIPVSCVVAAIAYWLAPAMTNALMNGNATALLSLKIFLLSIPFWVVARLCNSATQGVHKMHYQVISRDIGEQFSKFAFSVLVLVFGLGLVGVIWANVASVVFGMILSLLFAFFIFKHVPRGDEAAGQKIAKEMYRYSFPIAFSNLFGIILIWADTLMLGYIGTTADVGLYGVALRMGTYSVPMIMAFITVFQPLISDLYNRGQIRELHDLYKTITRWMFICSLPVFLALILFAGPIMKFFGSDFADAREALIILAVGQLINASIGSSGIMVVMSGRSKMELLNVVLSLLTNILICILLIPAYGIIGAALANTVSTVVINLMRMAEVWIFMRMHAYEKTYFKPVLAGIFSTVIVLLMERLIGRGISIIDALAFSVLLGAIYLAATIILGLEENDRTILRLAKKRLIKINA